MKIHFTLLLAWIVLIGCHEERKHANTTPKLSEMQKETPIIPSKVKDKSLLHYNKSNSTWSEEDVKFSGFAVSYYANDSLKEKIGILNGKKQNACIEWYPDGHLKKEFHYHNGKLDGASKLWAADSLHTLISHLNYKMGKLNGKQRKWYSTGEIFKILNLNNGREEGLQKAYRKNGALFANYEAREGRIFGLKKTALCYGLDNENIQYEK